MSRWSKRLSGPGGVKECRKLHEMHNAVRRAVQEVHEQGFSPVLPESNSPMRGFNRDSECETFLRGQGFVRAVVWPLLFSSCIFKKGKLLPVSRYDAVKRFRRRIAREHLQYGITPCGVRAGYVERCCVLRRVSASDVHRTQGRDRRHAPSKPNGTLPGSPPSAKRKRALLCA